MRDQIARFHGTTLTEPEAGRLGIRETECHWHEVTGNHRTTADGFVCPYCRAAV